MFEEIRFPLSRGKFGNSHSNIDKYGKKDCCLDNVKTQCSSTSFPFSSHACCFSAPETSIVSVSFCLSPFCAEGRDSSWSDLVLSLKVAPSRRAWGMFGVSSSIGQWILTLFKKKKKQTTKQQKQLPQTLYHQEIIRKTFW